MCYYVHFQKIDKPRFSLGHECQIDDTNSVGSFHLNQSQI
ncbi:hypothetical protein Mal35_35720 [Gimesia maris]|nr:hypothetical protein Mal35_35720 [Gimesia maris]